MLLIGEAAQTPGGTWPNRAQLKLPNLVRMGLANIASSRPLEADPLHGGLRQRCDDSPGKDHYYAALRRWPESGLDQAFPVFDGIPRDLIAALRGGSGAAQSATSRPREHE